MPVFIWCFLPLAAVCSYRRGPGWPKHKLSPSDEFWYAWQAGGPAKVNLGLQVPADTEERCRFFIDRNIGGSQGLRNGESVVDHVQAITAGKFDNQECIADARIPLDRHWEMI